MEVLAEVCIKKEMGCRINNSWQLFTCIDGMGKQTILILALSVLIAGCSKPQIKKPETATPVTTELQSGLPAYSDSIHGYLYSSQSISVLPGFNTHTLTLFASFRDPEGNLSRLWNRKYDYQNGVAPEGDGANILLKSLVYNETTLSSTGFGQITSYFSQFNVSGDLLSDRARWVSGGNLSFVPFDIEISRKFPVLLDSTTSISVSRSDGKTWDMDAIFTNYDSAGILIPQLYQSSDKKVVSKKTRYVSISGPELYPLNAGSTAEVSFIAYNYSYITIKGKKYLFELSRKYRRPLSVTN